MVLAYGVLVNLADLVYMQGWWRLDMVDKLMILESSLVVEAAYLSRSIDALVVIGGSYSCRVETMVPFDTFLLYRDSSVLLMASKERAWKADTESL